jgi:hypothetical protein
MIRTLAELAAMLAVSEAAVTTALASSAIQHVDLGGGSYYMRRFYFWRLWRATRGS